MYSLPPQNPTTASVLDASSVPASQDPPVAVTGSFDRPGAPRTSALSAVAGEVVQAPPPEVFRQEHPVVLPVGRMFKRYVRRPKRPEWRKKGEGGRFVSQAERELMEEPEQADAVAEAPSVLDERVGLTYTEVMVDEAPVVVTDGKCPGCGMRLQRGWCGRCRVRYAEGAE